MSYGICGLSLVPLWEVAQYGAPLVSEVLYGELFEVISIIANGVMSSFEMAQLGGLTMSNTSKLQMKNIPVYQSRSAEQQLSLIHI